MLTLGGLLGPFVYIAEAWAIPRDAIPACRGIVVQAIQLQLRWTMILRDGSQAGFSNGLNLDCIAPPEAAACHLVWAEYERIDWERIYAGESWQHDIILCATPGASIAQACNQSMQSQCSLTQRKGLHRR